MVGGRSGLLFPDKRRCANNVVETRRSLTVHVRSSCISIPQKIAFSTRTSLGVIVHCSRTGKEYQQFHVDLRPSVAQKVG